ncbi:carbamoyl transferase [Nonomuraea sp. WAC 01424]|uniref:carbamoyltransferase family protein n=1 Tax=Nonomuraea sp. WAC 01424 TaxID=2203200 RepID=UPI000F7837C6|nr:carbamoyltransferase C-terminal domain-containing protein [Nonomuraea sp. WAC 01424]RSN12490.1 carbamoyl transferase [Nonomuraea sp. WAC 01424]
MYVLGISRVHDSAAALVRDGEIVALAEEERFTRVRHDCRLPRRAVAYCLEQAGIGMDEVDHVAFAGPLGDTPSCEAGYEVHLVDLHRAYAAGAFYPGPFDSAAVLTMDGTGTCLAAADGSRITDLARIGPPHSLGTLYGAVTAYLGFRPGLDEDKVMGLAAYGSDTYAQPFADLLRLTPDGGYELDLSWFARDDGGGHTVSARFLDVFGPPRPPRPPTRATRATPDDPVPQHYMDIAYALQGTLERAGLHLARRLHDSTGATRLAVAGDVALNPMLNGRILAESGFEELSAQPAAASLGAALEVSVGRFGRPRPAGGNVFAGPGFPEERMEKALRDAGLDYRRTGDVAGQAAARIADGLIVGWFQGRMECGPRALGNRSLLADPRDPASRTRMNERVKHREAFRPCAPSCLAERAGDYFTGDHPSPVMLLGFDVLDHRRGEVPAITHVDGSARVQTVSRAANPLYHGLISRFEELTGVPLLANAAFCDDDEPIVCTPEEAVACYLRTDADALALGPFWTEKPHGEPWEAR